ncbi:Importin alpha subunit (Karyopherin alpha subunit) (Serine-rich RNA polymerase I suppressor protein) [Podila minutissima]|nr:Importin alpha subunit (Karyopherin alpha subunit) (Serine-rich RNA polymerase I suppressor protein) [Podila minutissima]
MLALHISSITKPRSAPQQKLKGSSQRDNVQDDEEDLIEQLNRKLSNVTLNPTTSIPDEMNITDISTMQLLAMVRIRKYLSLQDVLPRIDNVLALDCTHFFIAFLNMSDCPDLQYETAWVVTNIAAGTTAQTERLVEAGILAPLIHNLRVSRCTIWALGNISGDGPPYRDLILRSGALDVILSLIEMCEDPTVAKEQKYMILRIAVWCVSNLCRGSGRAAPEWLQVTPAFPMLRRLMYIDDTEILADTCWALCRILNGTHKMNLEAVVIDRELCARFVALLSEPHPTIQVPSLRSLINIASGPEHHTQLLIDAMAIPVLGSQELLAHRNSTIRRDALLGISNITAGTADQVREVTVQDNGNVMRRVLDILRRGDVGGEDLGEDSDSQEEGGDWRVLREAAWVVSNATSVLDLEITGHLVYRLDLLPSIAQLIDPRRSRKANYVLPAIGLTHPALLTKLLDIVFNVLRCNEHHPKEQFMKIWVNDCEGGSILLELLKLSGSGSNVQSRHLDNRKMVPRPLQHLRFPQNENGPSNIGTKSLTSTVPPLGPSVKKRVETILENFFEFGPENEGFGPFFSERQGGRPLHEGYGSDYQDDDQEDDLDDDDFGQKVYYSMGGPDRPTEDVDFDIDDMEERVGRMNLA